MMRVFFIITMFSLVLLGIGCASSGDAFLVLPEEIATGVSADSHILWGLWQFVVDADAGSVDVVQLRDASMHLNALKFLEPPVNLHLALEGPPVINGGILDVDVGLTHPFYGQSIYTGFDVCGIFIGHGSVSGFSDPDIMMPGEGDTRLLNADGYSRWWNPVEYETGVTAFDYVDGLLGTPDEIAEFNCTLNGYKYYSDSLGMNDDLNGLDPGTEWGIFGAGMKNVRHYTIDLGDSFVFNYAVDANWRKPTGEAPYDAPDDFPPGAWKPEAWNVSVGEIENTLWNDGVASGGNLSLSIEVWDHFDAGLNSVLVESPGNFDAVFSDTPVAGGSGYSTYIIDITGATPSPDQINLLITVEAPVMTDNPCAYFTYAASVFTEGQKCEGMDETEANDDCDTADLVTIDVPMLGCVQEPSDEWDYWEFEVTADGNYDLYLINEGDGDIDLAYYDSDCTWLGSSGLSGAGEDEEIEGIDFGAGTYFARVNADDDSGPYAAERHYQLLIEYNPPLNYSLAVAYYDNGQGNLKYAWIDSAGDWQIETVDDSTNDVGNRPFLVFDSTGHPHIFYVDRTAEVLKYAYNDGTDWEITSHQAARFVCGLEIDSNDLLHVLYVVGDFTDLAYATYDGDAWADIHSVDGSPGGTGAALALDADGYPHTSNDDMGQNLRYSYQDSGGWHSSVVYSSGGIDSWIRVDSDGYAHVMHSQLYSPVQLYHTYEDGSGWHTDNVTSPGYWPKFHMDADDKIYMTYTNGTSVYPSNHIIYAHHDGDSWSFETVDDTSFMMFSSFVLAFNGDRHVTYYDKTQGELKYAYDDGEGWTYEIIDSDGDVGKFSSLAMYGG